MESPTGRTLLQFAFSWRMELRFIKGKKVFDVCTACLFFVGGATHLENAFVPMVNIKL